MKNKILVTAIVTILIASFIPIIIEIVQTTAFAIIEVDDDGGKDYQTIQEAVDAAQPGDTVFVYAGIYNEDVYIDKTIDLTGISRDNTTINAIGIGIFVENADYVNISGFTVENGSSAGIRLMPSNNSIIEYNRVEMNNYGIEIIDSNNTIVQNNIASNNSDYHGIYVYKSTNITVKNNICNGNSGKGIYIFSTSYKNQIINNKCHYNEDGIALFSFSKDNYIFSNDFSSNLRYGIWDSSDGGNIYRNITIKDCETGVRIGTFTQDVKMFNSTIENSSLNDINVVGSSTYFTTINTTFNKIKSYFGGSSSNLLIVKWYLHLNVINYLGNPVSNVKVNIEDNVNSTYNQTFTTDVNGNLRWLTITEYIEQDTDGNNIGEKTYHTPHKITAWNDTLVGYAHPYINESKTITIVLYNGTLLDLEPGWNLISLPRPQSDTNLDIVLNSIEGRYDAVQWYNITDLADHWKHHHIFKPSSLNDLHKINHTIGFWIHIIDPLGTVLVVIGNELTTDQHIALNPGWNLIGFPSRSNKTRDVALDTLNFGSDIDSIWTYNSTFDKWIELNDGMDYFEIGQGYWIHSNVTEIWNVPL